MTVNAKQLSYLNEMGITLWQRRSLSENNVNLECNQVKPDASSIETEQAHDQSVIVELASLKESTFFNDLLIALNVTSEQVFQSGPNRLDIKDFSWTFHKNADICRHINQIKTPELINIQNDSQLKKMLWLTLYKE